MRETLEQWQEIRDRVRYSPSKCWQVVGLSVPEFLHLIDHYESLLLERNGMEVWQRLDRAHERIDTLHLQKAQQQVEVGYLRTMVSILEAEKVRLEKLVEEKQDILNKVLYEAVSSQYFYSQHDPKARAHFWDITNAIDPEIAKLLGDGDDARQAYDKAQALVNGTEVSNEI